MAIIVSSMVVNQIDVEGITIFKSKNDSPVARYGHTPKPAPITPQLVKAPTGKEPKLGNMVRRVQGRQNSSKPRHKFRGHLAGIVAFV